MQLVWQNLGLIKLSLRGATYGTAPLARDTKSRERQVLTGYTISSAMQVS